MCEFKFASCKIQMLKKIFYNKSINSSVSLTNVALIYTLYNLLLFYETFALAIVAIICFYQFET